LKNRNAEYTRYIENKWDVSEFVEPSYSGEPAGASEDAYFGMIPETDLAEVCDASIRFVHAVLAMIGTTGDMSWKDHKWLFGLISEGARRGLFTTDELDEVMNLLFDTRQASPNVHGNVGTVH
jgi:hypothetical protein